MAAKRKTSYLAGALILIVAVVGIIFIVNFFSVYAFTRLDLTQNQQFTLSPSTKELLAKLPDVVSIRGVFSSNIPSPYNQYPREVKDLLQEYKNLSKGKIDLQFVDPAGKEDLQEQMRKLGLNSMPLPVRGLDQNSVINIWASIYVQYLDRTEVIPMAFFTETLEYDLTSALMRVINEKKVKVGIFNVDEGRNLQKEFGQLEKSLGKQFEVEDVNTKGGKPIDQEIKVLIVPTPYQLGERDLFEIDQFIMRGGQAVFLADGARVFLQPGQYGGPMPVMGMAMNENMDQLGKLLKHYGVQRDYNLVMDKPFKPYPLIGNMLGTNYPLFPLVEINQNQVQHPITQGLGHVTMTWASSLELQSLPPTVKAVVLLKTSPQSWIQAGNQLMVDPTAEPVPPLPVPGMGPAERTLAVLLSGKFTSFYTGKEVPGYEPAPGDTAAPPPPPPPPGQRADQSPETNLLIIGCSSFVSDVTPVDIQTNLAMISSAVEWMIGGNRLSDIQKRKLEDRPLSDLTLGKVLLLGLVAPLAAPFGVIVFGVARFTYKKRQKNKFLESVQS